MRLRGTRTEKAFRVELIRSNQALQNRTDDFQMLEGLESAGVILSRAFVLHWTPEQGEDIYTVLGGADLIVTIEVDRSTGEVLRLERQSVSAYRHSSKQMNRIQLAVALDLHLNGVPLPQ